jgi:hypothetical protein
MADHQDDLPPPLLRKPPASPGAPCRAEDQPARHFKQPGGIQAADHWAGESAAFYFRGGRL